MKHELIDLYHTKDKLNVPPQLMQGQEESEAGEYISSLCSPPGRSEPLFHRLVQIHIVVHQ